MGDTSIHANDKIGLLDERRHFGEILNILARIIQWGVRDAKL